MALIYQFFLYTPGSIDQISKSQNLSIPNTIVLVISFRVYSDYGTWFLLYINRHASILFLYYRTCYFSTNAIFASFNNLFVINHSTKIMSKHYKCVHK